MTSIRVKALKPLPEPLPDGEHVLWQGSPSWRPFSRRVFQLDKIAIYFSLIVGWVAISAYVNGGEWLAVSQAMAWAVPPALAVLALLALAGWLYARTSVYTITSKRVVIQSGVALPTTVNLPFSRVDKADAQVYGDGSGDIELTMNGPRLLYSMIWPNLRLLRLRRPVPMLRAIDDPKSVAELLGKALAAEQESAGDQDAAAPAAPKHDAPRAESSGTSSEPQAGTNRPLTT